MPLSLTCCNNIINCNIIENIQFLENLTDSELRFFTKIDGTYFFLCKKQMSYL